MIDLLRFEKTGFEAPNHLRDHRGSYRLAETYATGGLNLIEGEIETNTDSETYANMLIEEMNEMYEERFG